MLAECGHIPSIEQPVQHRREVLDFLAPHLTHGTVSHRQHTGRQHCRAGIPPNVNAAARPASAAVLLLNQHNNLPWVSERASQLTPGLCSERLCRTFGGDGVSGYATIC